MSAEMNPFTMPKDEQVIVMRDEERRFKELERKRLKSKPVHEKTTWSTRIGSAATKTKVDGLDIVKEKKHEKFGVTSDMSRSPTSPVSTDHHDAADKLSMADYIKEKRKMGLKRMTLATKKQEIKKLEEEAERAEKRVQQLEEQLKATDTKFEDFMKQNNLDQVDAMKKVENEAKLKQEKQADIKKLNAAINVIENEKKRIEEQLNVCLRFKKDLDALTPDKHFRDVYIRILLEDRQAALERKMVQESSSQDDSIVPGDNEAETMQRVKEQIEKSMVAVTEEVTAMVTNMKREDVIAELDKYPVDRVPMFFVDHTQIMNIFVEIEEANLVLITMCQKMEEELDGIKSKFAAEKVRMDNEAANLRQQIEVVKQRINVEEGKKRALLDRKDKGRAVTMTVVKLDEESIKTLIEQNDRAKNEAERITIEPIDDETIRVDQKGLLKLIKSKVTQIFRKADFQGDDSSNSTVMMLTRIETCLEELRNTISNEKEFPPDFVSKILRNRDKERRQAGRQKILDAQRHARDKRSEAALLRSQNPVVKRIGKPVMFRSKPNDIRHLDQNITDTKVHNEDDEFFQ
eukprot:PhF_6_TR27799/c1_g1_i1/m.40499